LILGGGIFVNDLAENAIHFGSNVAPIWPYSSTQKALITQVPILPPGPYEVQVTNSEGASNVVPFTILPPHALSTDPLSSLDKVIDQIKITLEPLPAIIDLAEVGLPDGGTDFEQLRATLAELQISLASFTDTLQDQDLTMPEIEQITQFLIAETADIPLDALDLANFQVPEPSILVLFSTTLLGLLGYGLRQKRA
jgi:hypothetical protein